jgi:hypothetical protein
VAWAAAEKRRPSRRTLQWSGRRFVSGTLRESGCGGLPQARFFLNRPFVRRLIFRIFRHDLEPLNFSAPSFVTRVLGPAFLLQNCLFFHPLRPLLIVRIFYPDAHDVIPPFFLPTTLSFSFFDGDVIGILRLHAALPARNRVPIAAFRSPFRGLCTRAKTLKSCEKYPAANFQIEKPASNLFRSATRPHEKNFPSKHFHPPKLSNSNKSANARSFRHTPFQSFFAFSYRSLIPSR